jgi:RHS repeat-associated protein
VGAGPAYAATHIPTTTYTSNTTWTTANSPYVLDGNVTVASGVTLTINPGVIVKFNGTLRELRVNGTLSAVGTGGSHIIFTSYQDDSAGGDTNGDGTTTTGAAGQWTDINITSGNSNSQLKFADVRYGGNGSANSAYGALRIGIAGTSVTVEDSTFTNNQRSGIFVSVNDTDGVTVRRTTLSNNGNGISVNQGWVKVEDNSSIRNNTQDGLWFNITSSFTGPQSSITDSEVKENGRDGVRLTVDASLDASKWPRGTRNNIYNNAVTDNLGEQLFTLNTKRTADWKYNYFGDGIKFTSNLGVCLGSGQQSFGKLAYNSSQTNPPDGPIGTGNPSYSVGATVCGYDRIAIGSTEFQKFPYRIGIGMRDGQAIGCGEGDFGVNAAGDCKEDPVNTATGSFTHEVSDLALPGIGVDFDFTRHYNSIDQTSGPLGIGWTHNYNSSLIVRPGGDVIARAGTGQQVEFVKNADGSFTGAKGARSTLATITGGYELITNDQLHYRFDTNGKLTSLHDRNDKGLGFAYDGNGRLSTITDASSRQITFTYDGSGLLTQVWAPGPRSVSYGYTNGQLTSFTDAAGKVWTYTYEQYGFLEKEIDPLSHTLFRNVYGSDGRVSEQYDALNNKTTFAWDPATQTQTITDARNNVWKDIYTNNVLQKETDALGHDTQYVTTQDLHTSTLTGPDGEALSMTYDGRGNLLTATAPASIGSAQKTFTYDSQNNPTTVTDARGKATNYGYDANGNNTTLVKDGVPVATYTYSSSGQVASFKDGRDNSTTYTYDANGNLQSQTDPLGRTTTYTYDAAGHVLTRVDPRGNVQGADPDQFKWTYTYDAGGRLLTATDPLAGVTTYVYDSAGKQTSFTDANNKTTSYAYDAAGRLVSVTAPASGVTAYTYDSVGHMLTQTDPNNKQTTYSYDADGRVASVTTPLGNKTTYTYDMNGQLTKQVEPRGNVQGANPDDYETTFTYDTAGRLLTRTDPLGHTTTYTYDKVGNRTTVTDANNHTTTFAYNGRNLLTSVTAQGGAATTYTYDAAGNLASRTDPKGHGTTYVYNTANELTSVTLPLDREWTYDYDAAGNRTLVVDANGNATQTTGDGTTIYSYDRANRLSGIDYSDSTPDVTLGYDAVGNRLQMTDGAGTESYAYDGANRLTQVTRSGDTFSYTYDLAGNVTRRALPDSTIVDYTYDDDSRLTSAAIDTQATTYAYDPAGNLTESTLPSGNGYVEDRTYDRAGQLTRVKTIKGTMTLADFTYTLDPVGNPTKVVRAGSSAGTTSYAYDSRDRITEVCSQDSCPGSSDPFIRWTYDSVGNRLTETRPTGTTNYSYDSADELTAADGTTYTYDPNGNETAAGAASFNYDLAGRLASATIAGTTTTYTYDGDGNRTQSSTGPQASDKTNYRWDVNNDMPQLSIERDGNNTLLRRYVYGARRLSMTTAAGTYYYAYDALGSVSNLVSASGSPLWTYSYEPFGTQAATQDDPNAPTNRMGFAGEYLDPTNLYDLRARMLDPVTGRLLASDPASPARSEPAVGAYVYADDRPTTLVDPSGRTPEATSDAQDAERWLAVSPDHVGEPGFVCPQASLAEKEKCAFNFFLAKNLTNAEVAGVVGNLWYESGQKLETSKWEIDCSPHSWNTPDCGIGIAQWTPVHRKHRLLKFAGGSIQAAYVYEVQLAFVWDELTSGDGPANPNALRDLRKIKGANVHAVYAATLTFMREFEHPDESRGLIRTGYFVRRGHAWKLFGLYGTFK